jgi:long-chain fatty acid transport protein
MVRKADHALCCLLRGREETISNIRRECMKKILVGAMAATLTLVGFATGWAGGIDNKHNWSSEYIRTLNRNGATDAVDIVAYNPAGVMKMEDGAYINASVQHIAKEYTNTVSGSDLVTDEPSLVPALFGLYKTDKWAALANFTVPGGGGKVMYPKGNWTTRGGGLSLIGGINGNAGAVLYDTVKNEHLDGESYYYGFTIGGAFAIHKIISVSLGGRYIQATKELNATLQIQPTALGVGIGQGDRTAVLNYEETADGFGGIIGVNISPTKMLNIGLRYETSTPLDFEYEVAHDTVTGLPSGLGAAQGIIDGAKHRKDLPAILALGVSHQCTPRIRVETDFNYYLNKEADWGGAQDNIDNSYDIGIAVMTTLSEKLNGSLGYMHTETGIDDARYMLAEAPELDANTVGAGLEYYFTPGIKADFAVGKVFYQDATASNVPSVVYRKNIIFLALGFQYKFM